jgi:hypothetical protein
VLKILCGVPRMDILQPAQRLLWTAPVDASAKLRSGAAVGCGDVDTSGNPSGNPWRCGCDGDSLVGGDAQGGSDVIGPRRVRDVQDRLRELSAQGDPLEKLATTVDVELFRADLTAALGQRDRSKGGRPAFDPLHGLSLAQTEYLVADRLSWMRFCRLGPGDAVPDANTLWDFREMGFPRGADRHRRAGAAVHPVG